jgi:plastocyanin
MRQSEKPGKEDVMRRLLYLVALSLMTMVLIVPTAGAQQGQNVTVMMEDNYFEAANITVPAGSTVTWVQNGNNPHTTTSYDGLWDSGIIQGGSGGSFSFTFNEPGTYEYFCMPHENQGMVGTVTVTGGGGGAQETGQMEVKAEGTAPLPPSGGFTAPSVILPAAALLLGAGALTFAVLRRRTL